MTNSMASSNECHSSELDNPPDTASPTTSGAAHRVLSTTELLCSIAAHLPPKDILTTGTVCRDWRAALAADPTIQEALFLKPREIREVFAHDLDILDPQSPVFIQECTIIGDVNPWISEILGPVYGLFSVHPFINAEFQSRGGLWREMFVTQPPCKAVNVSTLSSFLLDQHTVFEREAGIKVGELYDFIEEEIRDCPDRRETLNIRDFFLRPSVVSRLTPLPDAWSVMAKSVAQRSSRNDVLMQAPNTLRTMSPTTATADRKEPWATKTTSPRAKKNTQAMMRTQTSSLSRKPTKQINTFDGERPTLAAVDVTGECKGCHSDSNTDCHKRSLM